MTEGLCSASEKGRSLLGQCRNCGRDTAESLGFIGAIAPFVLKRVLNLELGISPAVHPVKKLLRKLPFLATAARRVYGSSVMTEMEICRSCTFVQTKIPFSDESLARLYDDYRSDSYNRERIHYEPSYAKIADDVGRGPQELAARKVSLTEWLASRLTTGNDFSMLDYGGADGKFLPSLPGQRYVFDISSATPQPGIAKIKKESDLGVYSYVQIAHVLEHVPDPLLLTSKVASFLKPGGYLYIEVPIEISVDDLNRLLAGDRNISIPIHEHINRHSVRSVSDLLRSANLIPEAVETAMTDLGWIQSPIIRALARSPA